MRLKEITPADLQRENEQLGHQVKTLLAALERSRVDAAKIEGEIPLLIWHLSEVVGAYRAGAAAKAHGHGALAAKYNADLAYWIGRSGDLLDMKDQIYSRFEKLLVNENASKRGDRENA